MAEENWRKKFFEFKKKILILTFQKVKDKETIYKRNQNTIKNPQILSKPIVSIEINYKHGIFYNGNR